MLYFVILLFLVKAQAVKKINPDKSTTYVKTTFVIKRKQICCQIVTILNLSLKTRLRSFFSLSELSQFFPHTTQCYALPFLCASIVATANATPLFLAKKAKYMKTTFPADDPAPTFTPITIRLTDTLLRRIDGDVAAYNLTHTKTPINRTERVQALLDYAYQTGTLNQFIDQMQAQYMSVLSVTPTQIAAGAATHSQADRLENRVFDIEKKIDNLHELLNDIAVKLL